MCVCVCVCACVRACVRSFVRACVCVLICKVTVIVVQFNSNIFFSFSTDLRVRSFFLTQLKGEVLKIIIYI